MAITNHEIANHFKARTTTKTQTIFSLNINSTHLRIRHSPVKISVMKNSVMTNNGICHHRNWDWSVSNSDLRLILRCVELQFKEKTEITNQYSFYFLSGNSAPVTLKASLKDAVRKACLTRHPISLIFSKMWSNRLINKYGKTFE